MALLSQLAENLTGSEIVRLGNEINERIRRGEKIYNYTIGDFDPDIFPIPAELEQLIIKAYQERYTNYPPGDGLLQLRESVISFVKEFHELDYQLNETLIASGGRPLIYSLFKTIVDEGDQVIYAVPSWNNNHYTKMNHGKHCVIQALPENNFMPRAEDIAQHISGAVLICLCTPQNPTGTVLQKDELKKICELIVAENNKRQGTSKKLYLMFDQMYGTLTYGETVHHNPVSLMPEMKPYTIFIDGISKAFAATGVRVGWSLGPANVIAKMKALLSHIGAWAPMAEQKATAQYLLQTQNIRNWLAHFKKGIEERLVRIYEGFMKLKQKGYPVDAIAPQAAIYLTVKCDLLGRTANGKILETQSDVTSYILSEAKLAIVPFYAFGADKNAPWYRLSVGTCILNELPEMFEKLEAALSKCS